MKVSFIILTLRQYKLARQCIDSLKKHLDVDGGYEIILVSQEHERGKEAMFKDCKIIKTNKNVGYSRGNNLGAKKAKGEYICILNDDFIFIEPIFRKLFEVFENPNLGKVGNVSPTIFDLRYKHPWTYSILNENGEPIPRYDNTNLLLEMEYGEYCPPFLIPKDVFNEVGRFDERFYPFNYEDVDFNARLRLYGYKSLVRTDVMIKHLSAATIYKLWSNKIKELHLQSKQKFKDKWGSFLV